LKRKRRVKHENPEKFNAFDGKRYVVRADEMLTAFVICLQHIYTEIFIRKRSDEVSRSAVTLHRIAAFCFAPLTCTTENHQMKKTIAAILVALGLVCLWQAFAQQDPQACKD
jgi:hypothetical protein